jgi:hypothetical protein
MIDLRVIDDPASASVAPDPMRSRLFSELRSPESAPGGRRHRLMIGAYPKPEETKRKETT